MKNCFGEKKKMPKQYLLCPLQSLIVIWTWTQPVYSILLFSHSIRTKDKNNYRERLIKVNNIIIRIILDVATSVARVFVYCVSMFPLSHTSLDGHL